MLSALELKIPPPIVFALLAAAMVAVDRWVPQAELPIGFTSLPAVFFAVAGVVVSGFGILAFRRAKTSVHSIRIDRASTLVTDGIYTASRNPMYLGLAILLFGLAIYLSNGFAFLGPVLFAAFITRFQIMPEERQMSEMFGKDYVDYRARVRRWF